MPFVFNVHRKDQYVVINAAPILNPRDAATFEAVCTLYEAGDDPTVVARPAARKWGPPFVAYRLGFHGSTRCPEFQLLFEGHDELTTIRSDEPIPLRTPTHLAGTYDGKHMRLYVNGTLVQSLSIMGTLSTSDQATVFASRSSTDLGGVFVGILQEYRIWEIARSIDKINSWKFRLLPTDPQPEGLVLKQAYAIGVFVELPAGFGAHSETAGPWGGAGWWRFGLFVWHAGELSGLGVAADRSIRTPASSAADEAMTPGVVDVVVTTETLNVSFFVRASDEDDRSVERPGEVEFPAAGNLPTRGGRFDAAGRSLASSSQLM